MKNLKILLVFGLLTSTILPAQTILPTYDEAPEWNVRTRSYLGGLEEYFTTYYLLPSVDACGETWQVLWENNHFLPEDRNVGYYTERDEQVYFRFSLDCSEEERLIYDFSAAIGDTIPILETHPIWGDTLINYEVIDKGVSCFGGIERRFMRVIFELGQLPDFEYDFYFTDWVAGIGDLVHPFKSLDCVSQNDNFCETEVNLQCLLTDTGVRYSDGEDAACAYDLSHLTRIYVDASLPPFSRTDGSQWACAFRNLQDALAIADYGDSIWVATGTYLPSGEGDRTQSFRIANGIKVYGGFAGTEQQLQERDWLVHPTYLSGELGDTSVLTDNSFHVLYMLGADTATLVDGFVITRGYADELVPTNGENWRGAGALLSTDAEHPLVAPHFRNCHFIENHARSYGGAVYCLSDNNRIALPKFTDCQFTQNDAFIAGGIYKSGPVPEGQNMTFQNCDFIENQATECASVFLEGVSCNVLFEDCHFLSNHALTGSGGIQFIATDSIAQLEVKSCTFTDNEGGIGGAIFTTTYPFGSQTLTRLNLLIINCEFTANTATNGESGGIMVDNSRDIINIDIQKTTFIDNQAAARAGALTVFNEVGSISLLHIDRCNFNGNIGGEPGGGAISLATNFGIIPSSFDANISNTLLTNNRGAVSMGPGDSGRVALHMNHCTTYGNGAYVLAKTWGPAFDSTDNRAQAYLENNIFWETEAPLNRLFYNGDTDIEHIKLFHLRNNLIHASACDAEGCDEVDLGGNQFSTEENAPLFIDIAANDFRLRACSPAINAGDTESTVAAGLTEDFAGGPRILEDTVDIGAYERLGFRLTDFATILHATDEEANDGSIRIDSIQGGTPPLQLEWEDGSTLPERSELFPGNYSLTVTDDEGCSQVFEYLVDVLVSTTYELATSPLLLFPNPLPVGEAIQVRNHESVQQLTLYNSTGQLIWQGNAMSLSTKSSVLPTGLFWLSSLGEDGVISWQRMVVQ